MCARGLTEVKVNHIKWLRIKEAFGWLECKMINHLSLSDRNVWAVGEVLDAEVKNEAFKELVDVARAKPLNHTGEKYS